MCGIFGVINTKEKIDLGRVLSARDILTHRGPDYAGIYFSQNSIRSFTNVQDDTSTGLVQATSTSSKQRVESYGINKEERSFTSVKDDNAKTVYVALAHRRLSIIDLSPAAHQPMSTVDGRYTIVYNGEIYNFSQIKNEKLKIKNFKTDSDTEVILNLYEKLGKDCLKFLRGMFAFAMFINEMKYSVSNYYN